MKHKYKFTDAGGSVWYVLFSSPFDTLKAIGQTKEYLTVTGRLDFSVQYVGESV